MIFAEAFNFKAATGGAAGYGVVIAMHYGFSRGVFSNEAGLGSAPIAHAASSTKNPVKQGLWGMFEVFSTTIIICTVSALFILTTGIWETGTAQGAVSSLDLVWSISETMNGLMAIPNLIGIIGLSKVVKSATKEHFDTLK